MTAPYGPHELRHNADAFDLALAVIAARHEQHKADIQRTSDRLERVAAILGKVGVV